jgi:hypothetical protein
MTRAPEHPSSHGHKTRIGTIRRGLERFGRRRPVVVARKFGLPAIKLLIWLIISVDIPDSSSG